VYRKLHDAGINVAYFYSWRALRYCLTARYVVTCVGYDDVSYLAYLLPWRTVFVNLWHGTPLKRLRFGRTLQARIFRRLLLGYLGRPADWVSSASDEATDKLNDYFRLPRERFLVSGYPRNDGLFSHAPLPILARIRARFGDPAIALCLPTFRQQDGPLAGRTIFHGYGFDAEALSRTLAAADAVMLIKLHFCDQAFTAALRRQLPPDTRLIFLEEDEVADLYPLLGQADILLTDYSSVFFDYLLLDRPIIFTAFDREDYENKDRGFYYEYDRITPGTKTADWPAVCTALETYFADPALHADRRREAGRLFNAYADDKNCERLYHLLIHARTDTQNQKQAVGPRG
jgi:CDP-glycerol glycerophosphotransferase (TagB/SpsB family)